MLHLNWTSFFSHQGKKTRLASRSWGASAVGRARRYWIIQTTVCGWTVPRLRWSNKSSQVTRTQLDAVQQHHRGLFPYEYHEYLNCTLHRGIKIHGVKPGFLLSIWMIYLEPKKPQIQTSQLPLRPKWLGKRANVRFWLFILSHPQSLLVRISRKSKGVMVQFLLLSPALPRAAPAPSSTSPLLTVKYEGLIFILFVL